MKPHALRFLTGAGLCLAAWVGPAAVPGRAGTGVSVQPEPSLPPNADVSPAVVEAPPPLSAGTPAPSEFVAPPKPLKPFKKPKAPGPAKVKAPKEIPFPLPVHEKAKDAKIPEMGIMGQLLSQMSAVTMTHSDNEHVQMQEMKIDLYHPDGKEDFHITMPTSTFNLKTRIITSDDPVVVRADDFELIGDRMEFNTVDRTGKLLGHIVMHIHNLKQVAAVPVAAPTPVPALTIATP